MSSLSPNPPSPASDRELVEPQSASPVLDAVFREIAETVDDVFAIVDLKQAKVTYVNSAYEKLSGKSREKLLRDYTEAAEVIYPDDRQRICESFRSKARQGAFDEEFRIRHGNGTIAWMRGRCYPIADSGGKVARVICVAQDITGFKLAQELAQRHSQIIEQQAQLLEVANDAIITRNSDAEVQFWNKAAEALYGWTAAEAHGQNLHRLLATQPERVQEFRGALAKDGEWLGELSHRTRSGKEIVVQSRHVVQRDANGKEQRILEINRDISEQKKAEAALIETQQHLEHMIAQRTAALQELSGRLLRMQDDERRRIARELHDSMGQELSVMKMMLEAALQRGIVNPQNEQTVLECLRIAENVLRQVRSLSYLLHPPLLDEMGLAPALNWYVEGLAQRSGLQISLAIEPHEFGRLAPELETAVFRIVQESLTNVYKHSESPTASVRLSQSDSEVRVHIADHGKGIPAEKLDRLSSSIGVGIGGMRERVRQFGGDVKISSNDTEGTTIEVVFPLRRPSEFERSSSGGVAV